MVSTESDHQQILCAYGGSEPKESAGIDNHILVDAGTVIFREGERGSSAFLIERGEVEISVRRNGEDVSLAHRGPGEVFGEMAIIDDQPRSATVTASQPCQLLMITRDQLVNRIEQTDPVLRMCLRVILQRFRTTLLRVQAMDHVDLPLRNDRGLEPDRGAQQYDEAVREIKLEEEIRHALRQEDFALYYQPIIDLHARSLAGFESLIRWRHKHRGMIAPDVFIPTAEASGLIVPISHWVFEEACQALVRLDQDMASLCGAHQPIFMSINLSVRDFANLECVDIVRGILDRTGVAPERLKIEITESLLMHQPEVAATALSEFKTMNISIAIDDFGTGYSSLSYLHKFPIDTLKIDRSFIRTLEKGNDNYEIVGTIINMADRLKMKVVAEGVEYAEQADLLRDLGCLYGQGYHYAKPAPERDIIPWLQQAQTSQGPL